MRTKITTRTFLVGVVGVPAMGVALVLGVSSAEAAPAFAATASISAPYQYLGDTAGTVFTFTINNTGTDTSIGAVEIQRPSGGWSLQSCVAGPAGWTTQSADPKCRFRSASVTTDDIMPGESRTFTVRATTLPGTSDRVGNWQVTVSKSSQFDNPSILAAAAEVDSGLVARAYTWEVIDAVVADGPVAAGSACPAPNREALTSSTHTIVICGRNHATVPLTPSSAWSSLGGTFLATSGAFSSGQVPAGSGPVVVGSWNFATVAPQPGTDLTVIPLVASAANQTSPATVLGGYEAVNAPPIANDDAYDVAEDGSLNVPADGVLTNDTDPEGQSMTAVLETGPAHAASFALAADGSFDYVPAADYAGPDSFTYRAHDGINASEVATVSITVNAVNDAPVNVAPSSASVDEDSAYTFPAGSLSVSDADSGASDVTTHLTVAGATLTVGTTDVTVTGNDTGDVTVTGPVAAVAAAVDGLTLTPAPDSFGATTLTIETNDSGHTGSGGALSDSDSVAVTVNAVNDAPSFTAGPDQSVGEDAGTQTVAGWATDIDKGAANESGQTLTFEVTTDNPALFETAPAVSATGTLTYRTAAAASGAATVTVVLRDDGGTANGGVDTSAPATFAIAVVGVNDPPVAVDQEYDAQANMGLHVTGLLNGATDPADAAAYTPSFTLESVTPLSCAGCGIADVSSDGSFDFAPPAGQTGTFTLQYTIRDTGYPAPGVVSAPATVTINVGGPVIWFVDPSVAGPGTGTMSDPYKALSSVSATAGERIFVASGAVTGSVAQANGGWLVGQGVTGASFDSVMAITPPAGTHTRPSVNGTRPTVTGGVTLADNSVVRGLNLTPASGTAALAGNGADGVTVGEVSVTTTNARGVDLQASQGSTVSLTSVSATGSPSGAIRLLTVNTTTPGSFSVTGTGSSGSGGTISGGANNGVVLQNVKDVAFSWIAITGSGGDGVNGSGVTNYAMTDSTVSGAGTHGMSFANLTGTSSLTRVTVSGSGIDNTRVFNSAGSATLAVTNSSFRDNNATSGGNGLYVDTSGTASMALTSTTSSYLRNRLNGLAVFGQSSGATSATVTGNTFVTDAGVGLDLESNGTGPMTYAVSGGTTVGCATCGVPVNVYKATGATGTAANAMAGSISGMTITNGNSANAPGIWVHSEGAGASRISVTNNHVSQVAHNGILVTAGNGSNAMDATVTGNTVDFTLAGLGVLSGIQVDSGTLTPDTTKVCADIRTNTVLNPLANDLQVRNRRLGSTFRLPGYTGAPTDTTAVVNFLKAQNTVLDGAAGVGTSAGFAGGAACAAP